MLFAKVTVEMKIFNSLGKRHLLTIHYSQNELSFDP
jgi:hypothetical protein